MNAHLFGSIHAMVNTEEDPTRRSRLEQFIYAVACSWPTFSVHHAAQAAAQLAAPLDIYSLNSFQSVLNLAERLDLRDEVEWDAYGFVPQPHAYPVLLSSPEDCWSEPRIYYLRHEVCDRKTRAVPSPHCDRIPDQLSAISQWTHRRGNRNFSNENTYARFHSTYGTDVAFMLGNLWKIGAIALWEEERTDAASWAELSGPPAEGHRPVMDLTEETAWYRFRIGMQMGRDAFAEIALCLGNVFCNHLLQVWKNNSASGIICDPRIISLEAEAAGSIAIARLGGPRRRGASFFADALLDDDNPLPKAFRIGVVLKAAEQIQELLQGDTEPVVSAAWPVSDDPR